MTLYPDSSPKSEGDESRKQQASEENTRRQLFFRERAEVCRVHFMTPYPGSPPRGREMKVEKQPASGENTRHQLFFRNRAEVCGCIS
jgi:hypothetical protein